MESILLGVAGIFFAIISLQKQAKKDKISLFDLPLFWYINGLFLSLISILTLDITYQDIENYNHFFEKEFSEVRIIVVIGLLFVIAYALYRGSKAGKKRDQKNK